MIKRIRSPLFLFWGAGAGIILTGFLLGITRFSSYHEAKRVENLEAVLKLVEARGERFVSPEMNSHLSVLRGSFKKGDTEVTTLRYYRPILDFPSSKPRTFSMDYVEAGKLVQIVDLFADGKNNNRWGYDALNTYDENSDHWYALFSALAKGVGFLPGGTNLSLTLREVADRNLRRQYSQALDKGVDVVRTGVYQPEESVK